MIENKLVGFILSSKRRYQTLLELYKEGPRRPTELAKKIDVSQQSVSAAMLELQKRELVKCLNPEKKTWRVYAITEKGASLAEYVMKLREKKVM